MRITQQSTDWQTIRNFLDAGKRFRGGYVQAWFTPLTSIGLGIAIPFCIGKILAALAQPNGNPNRYVTLLVIISLLTLINNRLTFSAYLAWQPKVMAYLQTSALSGLINRSLSFHNNNVAGKLVSDALDYPSAFSQLSTVFFVDILPFVLVIVSGIIVVSLASPLIGLVLLVMTALAIGMTVRFRVRMAPYRKRRQTASKEVTAHLADTIVNTMTVKSFGNEKHELANHKKLNDILMACRLHDWGEVAKDGNYRIAGLLLFEIAFVLLVVHQVQRDPSLLATGIFAFSYTVTLSNRLFQIGTMMRSVEESLLLAAPMTEILRQSAEIRDRPGAPGLKVTDAAIRFEGVSFYYQDSAQHSDVFSGLDLDIKPGEKIGLVGPSGGGKTTLTKLLLRFEDLQAGGIYIDGQNIAEVTQVSLRQSIGYVAQEPLLFHRTIRENIAYGDPHVSLEAITEAARKAYALDFILELPSGFDTVVGERGVKLSGGQRQRIAIARAILKNAPILILDEATSALDSESEQYIQQALWELMKGRTAIVIAHRLSTIQRLDRIIVMDGGKIIEQGTHKQLLDNGGLYARLWRHQSGGFIDD